MMRDPYRSEIRVLLIKLAVHSSALERVEAQIFAASAAFRKRSDHRRCSTTISAVQHELRKLQKGAERAVRGWQFSLPELSIETIASLTGDYPFSAVDFVPVAWDAVDAKIIAIAESRTAVIGATVETHVIEAALAQRLDRTHLVSARVVPFPREEARQYLFGENPDRRPIDVRSRLDDFIRKWPSEALGFLKLVSRRVDSATSEPGWQNGGIRTCYSWAEPMPDARLVHDVLDAVMPPDFERPSRKERAYLLGVMDLLRAAHPKKADDVELLSPQIFSAVLTNWTALQAHQRVASRLQDLFRGATSRCRPNSAKMLSTLSACLQRVEESLSECRRRGKMGDTSPTTRAARATGTPDVVINLFGAARSRSALQLVRRTTQACRSATR